LMTKAVLEGRIVVKFDKIEAGTKGVELLEDILQFLSRWKIEPKL
jgi:hypothetical protein